MRRTRPNPYLYLNEPGLQNESRRVQCLLTALEAQTDARSANVELSVRPGEQVE